MQTDQQFDWKDTDWVAGRLDVDKTTVHRFLKDGTIPGVQLGKKWLVSESGLTAHLRKQSELQTFRRRLSSLICQRISEQDLWEEVIGGGPEETERIVEALTDRVLAIYPDKEDVFGAFERHAVWFGQCPDCNDSSGLEVWHREYVILPNGQSARSADVGDLCYRCVTNRAKAMSYAGGVNKGESNEA